MQKKCCVASVFSYPKAALTRDGGGSNKQTTLGRRKARRTHALDSAGGESETETEREVSVARGARLARSTKRRSRTFGGRRASRGVACAVRARADYTTLREGVCRRTTTQKRRA